MTFLPTRYISLLALVVSAAAHPLAGSGQATNLAADWDWSMYNGNSTPAILDAQSVAFVNKHFDAALKDTVFWFAPGQGGNPPSLPPVPNVAYDMAIQVNGKRFMASDREALNEGPAGYVIPVTAVNGKETAAVKAFTPEANLDSATGPFMHEVAVLQQVGQYVGHGFQDYSVPGEKYGFLAMTLFPGVTLNNWLTKSEYASHLEVWAMVNGTYGLIHQLLERDILGPMRTFGVTHNDLRPANILIQHNFTLSPPYQLNAINWGKGSLKHIPYADVNSIIQSLNQLAIDHQRARPCFEAAVWQPLTL